MNCPKCGKENPEGSKKCRHCGEDLAQKAAETSSSAADRRTPGSDGNENETAPRKKKKKKNRAFIWIIAGLAAILGIVFLKRGCEKVPDLPLRQQNYVSSDFVDFFKGMRNGLHETSEGKKYYLNAQNFLGGSKPPESQPDSQPMAGSNRSDTAESFALASEHFKLAQKMLKEVKATDPRGVLKECRTRFLSGLDQYISAADTFNEYTKAQISGDEKREKTNSPTDAEANYLMGEKLMGDVLLTGCQGDFFKYAKALGPADRGLIFIEYKGFFGKKFPEYQKNIEMLLDYHPPGESQPTSLPMETQPNP